MNEAFRLSRIRAPRGTLTAAVLLAAVFVFIGILMSSLAPEHTAAAPRYFDGSALTFANWLLGSMPGVNG